MSVKYTQRFVTGDFAYAEIEADDFNEFVEATANLTDHLGGVATTQAVEKVKSSFGKTTTVSGGGSFGNKGKQESTPDKIELGKHEGYTITINNGRFGYYANAYNYDSKDKLPNKNLPKGADPASFTLEQAIGLWAE